MPDLPVPTRRRPAQPMTLTWRRRARPMLGTLVAIAVHCRSDGDVIRVTDPAFARVQQFHDAMSRHMATSDVCRIAAAFAGETLAIGADTWQVLSVALALERASGGVFDVAVAASPTSPPHRPSGALLRLESDGSSVTVLAPLHIDLGGIAKGAAVDAAIDALRAHGATQAIVNAGGDLAVLGDVPQPIVVRGPGGLRVDAGLLADGAIATSGPFDEAHDSRLSVPAHGLAAWADRTVSVIAPRCVVADALTKVVAILGQEAAPLLTHHGASAFSVDRGGRVEHVAPDGRIARRESASPTMHGVGA